MVVAIDAFKIAYMPLPKAACTSVKAALALADPTIETTYETIRHDPSVVHGYYQTRRFRAHRWEKYEGWWRFCVVRDPFKRLMSAYSDRVIKRRGLYNSPKLRRKDATLPLDPDPDFFFQNLTAYKQASSVVKHHSLPAHLFIGRKPRHYDRIYKVEELDQLAADLSEQIGSPFILPRFNESSGKVSYDELAPKTQASLRDALAEEYEQLSEFYAPVW